MSGLVLFLKAHVKGYDRKDGKHVADYDTKRFAAPKPQLAMEFPGTSTPVVASVPPPPPPAPEPAPKPIASAADFLKKWGMPVKKPQQGVGKQYGFGWGGGGKSEPKPEPKAWHPKPNDKGGKVGLYHPHKPSDAAAWSDPMATATVPVGGEAPAELHGVPFAPWADAPTTLEQWDEVPGQMPDLQEPDFDCPHDREAAAGIVIQEPDGRVWLVSPSNAFGGYRNTFPKGRADDGLSLQATAIKEAFEESGLQVQITGFLGDFERTQTYTRYYTARRVGGTPVDMGWESQAVRLAPYVGLEGLLNGAADKPVREALVAAAGV